MDVPTDAEIIYGPARVPIQVCLEIRLEELSHQSATMMRFTFGIESLAQFGLGLSTTTDNYKITSSVRPGPLDLNC